MKSNTNYGQQVRKNGIHHQDEKVAITATSPLSYNSPRFAKIPDEKLIDANANKFDSKLKNKNDVRYASTFSWRNNSIWSWEKPK